LETPLSLGERVSRDGALTSRRGTGEGSVTRLGLLESALISRTQ
jgi:hypothetical protein